MYQEGARDCFKTGLPPFDTKRTPAIIAPYHTDMLICPLPILLHA